MNKKIFLYSLILFPCITRASQNPTTITDVKEITTAQVTLYSKTHQTGLLTYHVADTYYHAIKDFYELNTQNNASVISNISIINNDTGISFYNNPGTAIIHFLNNNKQLLISQLHLFYEEYKTKNDGLFFNYNPIFWINCIQSSPPKENIPDHIFIELKREDIEKILGLPTTQFWKRLKYDSLIGLLCIAAYLKFR